MCQREARVLPLNEKVKVLDLKRKEKNYMLRMLRSVVRTDLLSVKLWGKKKKFVLFCCCISNCQSYSHRVWWLLNEEMIQVLDGMRQGSARFHTCLNSMYVRLLRTAWNVRFMNYFQIFPFFQPWSTMDNWNYRNWNFA